MQAPRVEHLHAKPLFKPWYATLKLGAPLIPFLHFAWGSTMEVVGLRCKCVSLCWDFAVACYQIIIFITVIRSFNEGPLPVAELREDAQ